jgi:hypothetical protein
MHYSFLIRLLVSDNSRVATTSVISDKNLSTICMTTYVLSILDTGFSCLCRLLELYVEINAGNDAHQSDRQIDE